MERTTCTLIYYLRKIRIDKKGKAPFFGKNRSFCRCSTRRSRFLDWHKLFCCLTGLADICDILSTRRRVMKVLHPTL